ncbi:MAG: hypothetical protein Q4C16_01235 [Eubacteriales bacterium]|nr:hypothetical protein [Eubacteriales bacterium]
MKKGYHSTQKKYFNTIPRSEFYGIAIGYALGLITTGFFRIESQIPQLALAVIGFLIGYYIDRKFYRVKDEPDVPDVPVPAADEKEEDSADGGSGQ